jgi:aspartyl-tRNA(Asn)/glutamyl-tRNA(Gln) amidotransferase subunit A
MPSLAPKIKDAWSLDPIATYSMDSITIPPNLCGFPHISFPFDYIDGMPVGAQVVSGHFNDYSVIDFAGEWEKRFEYKFNYNAGAL